MREEPKMVARVYIAVFLTVSVLTGMLAANGKADDLIIAGLGFLLATLLFLGLVAVLPWWVDQKYTWKY